MHRTSPSCRPARLRRPPSAQARSSRRSRSGSAEGRTAFVDVPRAAPERRSASTRRLSSERTRLRRGDRTTSVLVLNPSLEGQRVLKARVVRETRDSTRAAPRRGAKDLPSLPLGSVTASRSWPSGGVRFPLGFALSASEKTYPAISVNRERDRAAIQAQVQRQGSRTGRIQIDVSLTTATRRTVLDESGRSSGGRLGGRGVGKGSIWRSREPTRSVLEKPESRSRRRPEARGLSTSRRSSRRPPCRSCRRPSRP